MIRRTLAVAGAVVMAAGFTSIPGPASADPGGTIQAADVVIHEVAAELDTTFGGSNLVGGYIELKNIGDADQNISGWVVTGCTTSSSFSASAITSGIILKPDETWLVADASFAGLGAPTADQDLSGDLLQAEGGALLTDGSSNTVDEMGWAADGTLNVTCASASTKVAVEPNDTQSINFASPWTLASPTPQPH